MIEEFLDQFSVGFYNAWIPAAIYFIFSTAFYLLLPKYKKLEFINLPRLKTFSAVNSILYYSFLFFCIFTPLKTNSIWLYIGISVYIIGMIFFTLAMFRFAITEYQMPITKGIYKYSRHPIYVSFFCAAFGIVIASKSYILLIFLCMYFITTFKIMKAEEKDCLEKFDHTYASYYKKTKMIINISLNNSRQKSNNKISYL